MDDLRALAEDLRMRGWRCASTSCSTTRRASTRGRRRRSRATKRSSPATARSRPGRARRLRANAGRGVPRQRAGQLHVVPELGRWVWTTFNAYQWDLDYANPEVFRAMAEVMLDLAATGIDVLRLDAVPFLWKRKARTRRTSPRSMTCCRRSARCPDRRARGRVQGGGDRRPAGPGRLPRRGPPRGQGVRPGLPQRAHGAPVELARLRPVALMTQTLRACRRCRRARAG